MFRDTLAKESTERGLLAALNGETSSHRMAAPVHQQTGLARRDDGNTQIHAAHGSARSFPDTVLERDDTGRSVVAVLEPTRDDADDPGMPTFRRDIDQAVVQFAARRLRFNLGNR